MRAHWEAIGSFLKGEGVDPEQLFERDFGAFMDLSPTAGLLAEAYRREGDGRGEGRKIGRPMSAAKAAFGRWGFLPSPTWSGFLIHRFEFFRYAAYVHPRDAFEPRRDVPRLLYPSDAELAAISVVIFHQKFPEEGLTLVTSEDLRAGASASAVLARHRGVVARAHDDVIKERQKWPPDEDMPPYEGEEVPPKNERGIAHTPYRAELHWPSRRAGKSFDELVPKPG